MAFDATRFYTPETRSAGSPNDYEAFVRGISSGQADYLSRMDSFYKQIDEESRQFDESLDERQRQYDATLTEEQRQFNVGHVQWQEEFGLREDMFEESTRQYDTTLEYQENARQDQFRFNENLRRYGSYDGGMNVQGLAGQQQFGSQLFDTAGSLAMMMMFL